MDIRSSFPIFESTLVPSGITYFDSAATTFKSTYTIDRVTEFYTRCTSSVARGNNAFSEKNTATFEEAREQFAAFIHADPSEIVFTSNCTDAINLVANGLCVPDRQKAVISILEHHSNWLPWQKTASVSVVSVDASGLIDLEDLENKVDEQTKIVAITYVSNVTGNIQPVHEIVKIAKKHGALVLIDAAQAVSHIPIDVSSIDCDFMVFSAHKMFGPSGVGMLYGKKESLHRVQPKNVGGGMVEKVDSVGTSFKRYPNVLEAGTPNIEGVLGLKGALDFFVHYPLLEMKPILERLEKHLVESLRTLPFIEMPFAISSTHIPLVCFRPKSTISIEYLAMLLADCHNIYIRSGYHCAQPLFAANNLQGALRVSLHLYNTIEEIDSFIHVLKLLQPILQ